jgi:hypothetical protein
MSSVSVILTDPLTGLPLLVAPAIPVGVPSFAKRMPDSPDRALVWTAYRTYRHPSALLDGWAVQVWGRGIRDDSLDVDDLMDPVSEFLASLEHVDVGPVHIDQVLFRSSAPMGSDSSNRTERADTFDLDITPPPTARRPV